MTGCEPALGLGLGLVNRKPPLAREFGISRETGLNTDGIPLRLVTAPLPAPLLAVVGRGKWQVLVDLSGMFWSIYLAVRRVWRQHFMNDELVVARMFEKHAI